MTAYFSTPMITLATATQATESAIRLGEILGVRVSATVVDSALSLVAYARADGITPHSVETSRRKANTAASTRRASAAIPSEFATPIEHGTNGLLTSIPGGVPIIFDGLLIGGLGIAGGPPSADSEIAHAVLAEIGADPV